MPKLKPKIRRGLLKVYNEMWCKHRWYTNDRSERITIRCYQEARDYARDHGYLGIKVTHV